MSTTGTTIDLEQQMLGEVEMVGRDRWEEIHRRAGAGGSIRAIARELDLDRKTVRRCLRQTEWKRYRRAARATPRRGLSFAAWLAWDAARLFPSASLTSGQSPHRPDRPALRAVAEARIRPGRAPRPRSTRSRQRP